MRLDTEASIHLLKMIYHLTFAKESISCSNTTYSSAGISHKRLDEVGNYNGHVQVKIIQEHLYYM